MSRLTVNTNDLQSEGLDIEDVILEGGNIETTAEVELEGGDIEVGVGGGGQDGRGIASIEQTTTSTEDGGINEVTQTLTDGTTAVFQIRNGSKGSQGVQGERGLQGPAGADWIPTQAELDSIAANAASRVNVPDDLADLNDDSTHRLVTDQEKTTWNGKSNFSGSYNDLSDKPTIPSSLADLSADSTHRTVTDTEKSNWNSKGTYSKPSGGIPASDIASGVIPTNCVSSTDITNVVYLTQAAYDALATKDANTLYIIPES